MRQILQENNVLRGVCGSPQDLSTKQPNTDADTVTNIVDIIVTGIIAKITANAANFKRKVATSRLKYHTYGEALTNADILQHLKKKQGKK